MMDQERIERARKAKKDEMPIAERNLLKLEAIKAAKTDGNRLFKEVLCWSNSILLLVNVCRRAIWTSLTLFMSGAP